MIGLEWEKVHREADRWEHAISADVEEKLVELLGDPMTCPHGNPIPGSKRKADRGAVGRAASTAEPGRGHGRPHQREARAHDEASQLVARARLIPGATADGRRAAGPTASSSTTPAGEHTVPLDVAEQMFVTPIGVAEPDTGPRVLAARRRRGRC